MGHKPAIRAMWLLIALALLARVHLLAVRLYDPDEFEHLHVGYCIAQGQVPYRDFFEHHGPLIYYLAAPLVHWLGPEPVLLTANRLVSFALVLLTLLGVWRLCRERFGKPAARLSLLWLITLPWFVEKSVEWRPDVAAMCLVTWSVWFLGGLHRSVWRNGIAAGMLLSLAALCTQKVVFLAGGALIAALITCRSQRRPIGARIAPLTVGLIFPWVIAAGWFHWNGALADFVRCVIVTPLTWPEHRIDAAETFLGQLLSAKGWAPGHIGLAVVGFVGGAYRLFLPRARNRGEAMIAIPVLLHFLAISLVPAVYLQYYLLGLPLLACQAAAVTIMLWDAARARLAGRPIGGIGWIPLSVCSVVFAAVAVLWMMGRSGSNLAVDSVPWLVDGKPNVYAWLDKLSFVVFAAGVITAIIWRRMGAAFVWLALFVPAVGRDAVFHLFWPKAGQMYELAAVHQLVSPEQTVLDGYTGYGCLRPHAFYWWWINHHSIPLMQRERALSKLQATIASGRPALILQDADLRSLDPLIGGAMDAGYRALFRTQGGVVFWLRKDLPIPDELGQDSPSHQ